MLVTEDVLMHYGIPGMKWGVRHDIDRRGRWKQRSKTKVGTHKGEHVYRITAPHNARGVPTYVTASKNDVSFYTRSGASGLLPSVHPASPTEKMRKYAVTRYKVNKDLKVADRDTVLREIFDKHNNHRIRDVLKKAEQSGDGDGRVFVIEPMLKKYGNVTMKSIAKKSDAQNLLSQYFDYYFDASGDEKSKLYDSLKKQGYDAYVDPVDSTGSWARELPLRIINDAALDYEATIKRSIRATRKRKD